MYTSISYYISLLRKDFTAYCNEALEDMGLTQGQLYYVLYIGKHPACAPKQLTKALGLDMAHTTRSLAKLVACGFVTQEKNPKDRRAHELHLTAKGEKAFCLCYDLFQTWDRDLTEVLSLEEQEQLGRLLGKVANRKGETPNV